jgi:molybdenum cofactor cytidylyltransferase
MSIIRPTGKKSVEGIILAAGLSTRMGRQKLLMEVGGIPVIRRVVRAALGSYLSRLILVTGHSNSELLQSLGPDAKHERVLTAVNDHPEQGMSSSLKTGMMMLTKETLGVMLILGDQPFLTSAIINRLLDEFHKQTDRILAPLVQGRRSNPVIFPADLFPELEMVTGDVGGRSVFQRHAARVVGIEMGGYYNDIDLDTADDLQRIRILAQDLEIT